ncbi:MAG: hypothetical protein HY982_01420 [Candidatus Magasanikbacteria bacterium]|nr:hypothetical protein [Candidatus Magasanikbacteria bacterium]
MLQFFLASDWQGGCPAKRNSSFQPTSRKEDSMPIRTIKIVGGSSNPHSFEVSDALLISSGKGELGFNVENHPFHPSVRGVVLIIQVKGVEKLPEGIVRIFGTTSDRSGIPRDASVFYKMSSQKGRIEVEVPEEDSEFVAPGN